jgi:hypothetical protein
VQPSDGLRTISRMVYALLVCTHDDCTDEFEAWGTLEELEALACECGCALQLISVSEAAGDGDPYEELVLDRAA